MVPNFPGLLCGVLIRVLPDFLLDHTLLNPEPEQRLGEYHSRWVQFVEGLARWKKTTFCLRFVSNPKLGAVHLYLLARAASLKERESLRRDIEFALEAYGIVPRAGDISRCQRLLNASEIAAEMPDPSARAQMEAMINQDFAPAFEPPVQGSVICSVTQEVTDTLWNNQRLIDNIRGKISELKNQPSTPNQILHPWLPLAFAGPSGSFLVPFKALASMPVRTSISVYLQPTDISAVERQWFEQIGRQARIASEGGPQGNDTDPSAELAERLCTRLISDLVRRPFLVSILCGVVEKPANLPTANLARSLAQTLQSVCRQHDGEPDPAVPKPPSGAVVGDYEADAAIQSLYRNIEFPLWSLSEDRPKPLARLDYLCDARAAATVFRFPVSTRGGVAGVEVRQPTPTFIPGPTVFPPDHESVDASPVPRRTGRASTRTISLGRFEGAGEARIDVEALVKHTLITGFTGSGKTTTVLHLLHRLWHLSPLTDAPASVPRIGPNGGGIPFLVIESAKQEYRGLQGIPTFNSIDTGLLIYTLGNETVAPFRLNPFALLPGVRVEAHINRLQACFEAALPAMPFLPSVLAEALEKAYRDRGWTLTDTHVPVTRYGRQFPRMQEFYQVIEKVLAGRGYQGEVAANVVAATKGRIKMLLMGSIGFMLNVERDEEVVSPDRLFGQPAVLELNDLNHQDKALVMMFLLTLLREYRELHPSNRLAHVTVIEEAHNVLGQVESQGSGEGAGADTRAKSVEAFCNLLAEVRSLGEGLVISDQSPNKLAPDAMRNTNVQIAHQLRDAKDRDSMANAMIMDDEQRDFLGKLPPGQAAVFYTGLQKATFLTAPDYRAGVGAAFAHPSDQRVTEYMEPLTRYRRKDVPFKACEFCQKRKTCDYRHGTLAQFANIADPLDNQFEKAMSRWHTQDKQKKQSASAGVSGETIKPASDGLDVLLGVVMTSAESAGLARDPDAVWCRLAHGFNRHTLWTLSENIRKKVERLCVNKV